MPSAIGPTLPLPAPGAASTRNLALAVGFKIVVAFASSAIEHPLHPLLLRLGTEQQRQQEHQKYETHLVSPLFIGPTDCRWTVLYPAPMA